MTVTVMIFSVYFHILDIVCNVMVSRRKYQNWNGLWINRGSVHNELCSHLSSSCLMWCEIKGNDTLMCTVMYSTIHYSKFCYIKYHILLFVQVFIFVLMWYGVDSVNTFRPHLCWILSIVKDMPMINMPFEISHNIQDQI